MAEIFSDKILIEAKEFERVCFPAKIGRCIEISAWEVDKENFDIYLVRRDEIKDDYFRSEGVMISERTINSFNKYHWFNEDCEACIVLFNPERFSRTREIHLRLTWIKFRERRGFNLQSTTFWRFVFVLILIVPLLLAQYMYSLTGDFLWFGLIPGSVYTILGIIIAICNREFRAKLGLEVK